MEVRIVATLNGGSGVMDLEDDKGIWVVEIFYT